MLHTFVLLAIVAFVGTPIWALMFRARFARLDRKRRKRLLLLHFMVILLAVVIVISPWSFTGVVADALLLVAAYYAYADLAFLVSLYGPRPLTWTLTVILLLPLLAAMALVTRSFSYGLALAIGEIVPSRQAALDRNYSYRIASYGGAATSRNGEEVRVFYHPTLAPFVEKQIFWKDFRDSSYSRNAISVELGNAGRQIMIHCPRADDNHTGTRNIEEIILPIR